MRNYGSDWIKSRFNVELSPFGVMVANLLADVFDGIYHLDAKQLGKVKWEHPELIIFRYHGPLSTYDDDRLTKLLITCHDRLVRLEITAGQRYLVLQFSPRASRPKYDGTDRFWDVHPSIEQAIQRFRNG